MHHDQPDTSSDVFNDNERDKMADMYEDQHVDRGSSAAGHWWIRRVQRDAEAVESLLRSLESAERGPLSLGKLTREYRKVAEGRDDLEPLSRDRLYGALVLLALDNRVRVYGDGADITTRTTFQARAATASSSA